VSKVAPQTNDAAEVQPTTRLARPSVESAKPTLTTNAPEKLSSTERQSVSPARVDGNSGSNPQVSAKSEPGNDSKDRATPLDTASNVPAPSGTRAPGSELIVDHLCIIDRQLVVHGIVVTSRECVDLPWRVKSDVCKRLATQAEICSEIALVKAMYIHGKNQAPSVFAERCKLYLREDIE